MIPKEKAIELVDRFKIGDVVVEKGGANQIVNINAYAKLFALRAVDEILTIGCIEVPYWQEVKKEIEKL